MERFDMNLNIRYDLPLELLERLPEIYFRTGNWIGFGEGYPRGEKGIPYWFNFDENQKHVLASMEPSGLHFSAKMNEKEWLFFKQKIKKIATEILGFKVGEIELGEV